MTRPEERDAAVQRFDVLLLGGTVIDGSEGAIATRIDVGIVGDRITALGDLGAAVATHTVRVDGSVVAPGFIDPHTHIEPALLAGVPDSLAPVLQGVTTCLTAPDGFGWAPLPAELARELWRSTAAINGSYPESLRTESVGDYLAQFEGRIASNVLPQAPHSAIRFAAMGWDSGAAGGSHLAHMRGLVGDWMAAGAAGLSLGLDYEPGARAGELELTSLATEVAVGGGTVAAHLRYQDGDRRAAWLELARIGEGACVPIVIAHEILDGEGIELLGIVRQRADVSLETYLYPASSTHLTMFVPHADRIGGPAAVARRLHDPATAARVEARLEASLGAELAAGERIVFTWSSHGERIGHDLGQLAAEEGLHIGAMAVRVLRDDPDALFVFRHLTDEPSKAAAARTIADPSTIVASDGIYRPGQVHPRGYGTFPRILRLVVREWAALDLPHAIHAMTGRTAARYRVPDRGRVEVGRIADIVVFDPASVTDHATWSAPRQPPGGIRHVLVNGVLVVRDGQVTGMRPGRVLAAA